MRELVVVRGGGDLATGCVQKLFRAGYGVVVLESSQPTAIRRGAAICEAVYTVETAVEDIHARLCGPSEALSVLAGGLIPVLIDPDAQFISRAQPLAVVDAILAKRNLGTYKKMARITVALGPGFTAPRDVDIVVETNRGHDLGRLIFEGTAAADTGVPAPVMGISAKRVVYSPHAGTLRACCGIGDAVTEGRSLAEVGGGTVYAPISGLLRGILPDGFEVWQGLKLADIDPRGGEREKCFTISDKARCIGGAVLEGVMYMTNKLKKEQLP